jgi:hypothetical protein
VNNVIGRGRPLCKPGDRRGIKGKKKVNKQSILENISFVKYLKPKHYFCKLYAMFCVLRYEYVEAFSSKETTLLTFRSHGFPALSTLTCFTKPCYADSIPEEGEMVKQHRVSTGCIVQRRRQIMGMLRVMSRRGDDRIVWDANKAEANDPEAVAAIREAERIFNEERARGATAFRVEAGKPVERLETFDRTAEQIVMVPRVVGG